MEISTSILSVKKENATKIFYDLEVAKTDYFHIDVMDGKFVTNNTKKIMYDYANTIYHISNLPQDIHLMVKNVRNFVEEFSAFNPRIISIHFESFENKENLLQEIEYIKSLGIMVGLAIKPQTDIKEILEYLPKVNLVLVMTVEPGKGGQKLIIETIDKIKFYYKYREENNLNYLIEADGGINLDNVEKVKNAGADIVVSGTAIINSENKKEIICKLKDR